MDHFLGFPKENFTHCACDLYPMKSLSPLEYEGEFMRNL